MRYRRIGFGVLAVTIIGFAACSKKTAFTDTTMKPWFDRNCQSCHGKGASNSGNWTYDASDYDGSIKANIAIIKQDVLVTKRMPPKALTQAELNTFQTWINNGFPAQ